MKRVGFILAFIATKLFWTLSWCKTVSYYTYFRYESMFASSGFILWKSRGVLRADSL